MWMHVKAMHSACVNFWFSIPQKHKRNPFQTNKLALKDKWFDAGIIKQGPILTEKG